MATWHEGYKTLQVLTDQSDVQPLRTGIVKRDKDKRVIGVGIQVGFGMSAVLNLNQLDALIANLQEQRLELLKLSEGY